MKLQKFPYIKTLMGLFFVFAIYNFAWPFVHGKERMQAFCAASSKGQSFAELGSRALTTGYRVSRAKAELAIVHDPKTFGRNVCYIGLHQEQVVSAKYGFND